MGRAYITVILLQIVAAVAALVGLRWLAVYVDPATFGRYTLYQSVVAAASLLLVSWPNAALLRFGREEWTQERKVGRTLGARFFLYVACVAVAALIAWTVPGPLQRFLGVGTSPVPWIVAGIVATSGAELAVYLSQATGRTEVYGYSPAVTRVTFCAGVLVIPWLRPDPAWTYLAGWSIGSTTLAWIVSVWMVPRESWFGLAVDRATVRQLLRYSWSLPFAAVSTYVVNWIDSWVIRSSRGIASVGVYGWAYQTTALASLAFAPIAVILTPRVIDARLRGDAAQLQAYASAILPSAALAATAVAVGLTLIFPVLRVAAPPAYLPAYPALLLLVSALPFQLIAYLVTPFGNAYERLLPKFVMASAVIAVVNTAGDLVLVPRTGMTGAAIATFTGFAVGALVLVGVVRRHGVPLAPVWSYALPAMIEIPAVLALMWLGPARGAAVIVVMVSAIAGAAWLAGARLRQHVTLASLWALRDNLTLAHTASPPDRGVSECS